jgi:hypothetical protein
MGFLEAPLNHKNEKPLQFTTLQELLLHHHSHKNKPKLYP